MMSLIRCFYLSFVIACIILGTRKTIYPASFFFNFFLFNLDWKTKMLRFKLILLPLLPARLQLHKQEEKKRAILAGCFQEEETNVHGLSFCINSFHKDPEAVLCLWLSVLNSSISLSVLHLLHSVHFRKCQLRNLKHILILTFAAFHKKILVPIIPIVSLCPFHIFHGLNSVHNAAHKPGLCVTQYLLLANVRSATAFKTSDAINELSCIDSCRFLKNLSLSFIFCACFYGRVLFGFCIWLGYVTSRKHLEFETRADI
ncbi:hypothetical protein IHE44_0007410 [Lamprotornis superbus]|uniref:Uncharacterized protein n=1 Tax=Lamprotornis superbus TaxID=245042 RepID=A0A835P0Q0_9PASS|nr:hypothetical protein IHE44_0007410 [Lamprotornis superbus]